MKIIKSLSSNNSPTLKYLQQTKDNHIIETGYYDINNEHILCISSQIGCLMRCIFCATTKPIDQVNPNKYFIRNLTSDEIINQVKNVLYTLNKNKLESKRVLFSYAGMGEPFLNYTNVIESIKILSEEFPNSRATISTIGTETSLIKKLAHEQFNIILKLHLSLHAPNDVLRKRILPCARQIKPALEALKYFSLVRNIPSKINYVLIKNINDSKKYAIQLAKLLESYPFIIKLSNLNNFGNFESSNIKTFELFERILASYGLKTTKFFSEGFDIQAGCGQLRRHFYNKK